MQGEIAQAYRSVGMDPRGEPFPDLARKALRREIGHDAGLPSRGDAIVAVFNSKREYTESQDSKIYWRLKGRGFAYQGTVDQNPKRDGLFEM